jgi:hypothetical protein
MSLKTWLLNTRAGNTMLGEFGLIRDQPSMSHFSYKIGKRTERKEDDYFLYFKKDNVSAETVDNFAFNELAEHSVKYGINFLKFQLKHSNDKENFLKYLQITIPERRCKYSAVKRERLNYYLAWVKEQLSQIPNTLPTQIEQKQENRIAVINNIQVQNEANNTCTFSIENKA